jgi:hypothetical protein
MFCSGCGHALEPGQEFCPQCGRAGAPAPLVPGIEYQVAGYANKIRTLGILWLVFAGLSLLFGFAGLAFARAFLSGGLGGWMHGPMQPMWIFPALMRFAWVILVGRAVLAAVAGWGLMQHAEWGRIVAIVATILNLFHFFPFGLALGVGTLIVLLGARNWTLYEQM